MTVYYQIFQRLETPMLILCEQNGIRRCEDANNAFMQMTGYSLYELQSESIQQMLQAQTINMEQPAVKSEINLKIKNDRLLPARVDVQPIPPGVDSQTKRLLIQFEDLSSYKWITEQSETHKVLLSGVVDNSQHIRFYRDGTAPELFTPDQMLRDETLIHFINEQDHERMNAILQEIRTTKRTSSFMLRTSKLSGAELELSILLSPTLDGYGEVKEFAFVISDLKPIDDRISSSMKLKIWMARRNVTASHLSAYTGISIQTISKLRNGKIDKPQRLTAELIASELDVGVHDIWPEIRK